MTKEINIPTTCKYCGGKLSGIRTDNKTYWQHCYSCNFDFDFIFPNKIAHWVKTIDERYPLTDITDHFKWTCDNCGKEAIINIWYIYDLTDYCPFCGAKMEYKE